MFLKGLIATFGLLIGFCLSHMFIGKLMISLYFIWLFYEVGILYRE